MFRFVLPVLYAASGPLLAGVTEDIAALKAAPDRATWDRLAAGGPDALPPILNALPADDPVAFNWLRTAFDRIAAAHAAKLPLDVLLAFTKDSGKPGKARRLALSALERGRHGVTDHLLDGWLNDPEFGADAVDRAVLSAEKLPKAEMLVALKKTFAACTDCDQAQALAKKLTGLGETPDVWAHLGAVRKWRIVGPFPVTPEVGLARSFPPESKLDLAAEYDGKAGKLRWQPVEVEEGKIDLVKAGVKVEDGSVVYAVATFTVPADVTGELRLSAVDNVTAWLNGKKVVERSNDYRSLYRADRYRAAVSLPAGETTLLLKLTKTRPDDGQQAAAAKAGRPAGAAANWTFQARVLDAAGKGLTVTQPEGKK